MTERAAAQLRRVAMACLVAIILMVASDSTPASGSVVPVCDTVAPHFSHPICAERIAGGLGVIVDLAVTDSGDVHVLGAEGAITLLRPGAAGRPARFELPGALMLEAGHRSLMVGTVDGVTRHRFARGEMVPDSRGDRIVADRPSAMSLGRLGRLFVAVSPTDCDGSCNGIEVFDALDAAPSVSRSIRLISGQVHALEAVPGSDIVFGLVVSEDGRTELMPIGDHRGGCATDGCTGATIPTREEPSGLAIVSDDLIATGHSTALVATGSEVWAVTIDGGVPVSVELLADSQRAAFRVTAGPGGEVYLAEATTGTIWRLWGER